MKKKTVPVRSDDVECEESKTIVGCPGCGLTASPHGSDCPARRDEEPACTTCNKLGHSADVCEEIQPFNGWGAPDLGGFGGSRRSRHSSPEPVEHDVEEESPTCSVHHIMDCDHCALERLAKLLDVEIHPVGTANRITELEAKLASAHDVECDELRAQLCKIANAEGDNGTFDRWMGAPTPLYRCTANHVAIRTYQAERGIRTCMRGAVDGAICNKTALLTFPDDTDGPLVHEAFSEWEPPSPEKDNGQTDEPEVTMTLRIAELQSQLANAQPDTRVDVMSVLIDAQDARIAELEAKLASAHDVECDEENIECGAADCPKPYGCPGGTVCEPVYVDGPLHGDVERETSPTLAQPVAGLLLNTFDQHIYSFELASATVAGIGALIGREVEIHPEGTFARIAELEEDGVRLTGALSRARERIRHEEQRFHGKMQALGLRDPNRDILIAVCAAYNNACQLLDDV